MKKSTAALMLCLMLCLSCACSQSPKNAPEDASETAQSSTEIEYKGNGMNVRIAVPDSWTAEKGENDESVKYAVGLTFSPKDEPELKYYFQRYEQGLGVCGTGLEEKEIAVNGMTANAGYYDGADYWSFISLSHGDAAYGLTWSYDGDGNISDEDIEKYDAQMLSMLDSLTFAD